MAVNLSENKCRVVAFTGGSEVMALIEPTVGMVTNHGPILSLDSGNYQIVVGFGSGDTPIRMYPHQCLVESGHAYTSHGWPTGVNVTHISHIVGIRANGSPVAVSNVSAYANSGGTVSTFTH